MGLEQNYYYIELCQALRQSKQVLSPPHAQNLLLLWLSALKDQGPRNIMSMEDSTHSTVTVSFLVFDSFATEQESWWLARWAWALPQDQWHIICMPAFPATRLWHIIRAPQSYSILVQFWTTCFHLISRTRTFTVSYFHWLFWILY